MLHGIFFNVFFILLCREIKDFALDRSRFCQISYNETARCKHVFIVNEIFNIAVDDLEDKKSPRFSRVLVVTELVVSGTKCNGCMTVRCSELRCS